MSISHDPISEAELEVLRDFRKTVYKRGGHAHSNSVSSRAKSRLYSTDPGFNHWDILDSGADMSVRTNPQGRAWETKITLTTAERGRNVEITKMSEHTVPSAILKKGIPLNALISPQIRRNITSAGEICDSGKGFEIHMHSRGAEIYPSGTLPIVDPKLIVAEAIRPPGGLYMFPPLKSLEAAKRAVTPNCTTSKNSATFNS